MTPSLLEKIPQSKVYDVIIVGGAIMGSSVAWYLSNNRDFNGRILVVEKDPGYRFSSTAHTNSCIRQQFSSEINIRISQYAAEVIRRFRDILGGDLEIPEIHLQNFGYLYLADSEQSADRLVTQQKLQAACGCGTQILRVEDVLKDYPFYFLDDIVLASHNRVDEGYFDGTTMFNWWRRKAKQNGVEYIGNEVVNCRTEKNRVISVQLKTGENLSCGSLVNCSGTRAARLAAMAGLKLPVEPRRRYSFVFSAEVPLEKDLPLTVDPCGVHVRSEGQHYLAGCPPDFDKAVDPDDFTEDHSIWQEKLWPAIAKRIPAFEAVKVIYSWVGHYAYNTFDQNAIVGPHPDVKNFIFVNGFSGHGLQQAPAMGRGVSELICYDKYTSLDLSPLSYNRLVRNRPSTEVAII